MEKSVKIYDTNEVYKLTDLIILFIGISIILLGLLSLYVSIPDEYIAGATIGDMFFVLADIVVLNDVIKTRDLVFHVLSLFIGVISFLGLPVFLIVFPAVKEVP
ncbi:hypothetical protein [Sporosarcina sp. Marseille-Q4943]|uniref:hypothetical protein n=1 Tax=Sporosarcina sp. Marseille-Q4943 TaxID=2942204 RepID=UPI00208DCEE7|nr:hypothetical protein [Sporosarcina sp. Marseille-Q4943]